MPDNLTNISWITFYNELKRLVSLSPFYTLGNEKLRERNCCKPMASFCLSSGFQKRKGWAHLQFSILSSSSHSMHDPKHLRACSTSAQVQATQGRFSAPHSLQSRGSLVTSEVLYPRNSTNFPPPPWRALEIVLLLEGKKSLALPHSQKLSRKLRSSPLFYGKDTLGWAGLWECGDQLDFSHVKSAFFNLHNIPSVLSWKR